MGLRHVQLPTRVIEVGGQKIEFRGVSFTDLMQIVDKHSGTMTMVFARVVELSSEERQLGIRAAIGTIAQEFPELVGAVIALASDDYCEETVQIAMKLPFNKQVEAVEAIFDLTFTSEGDIKKLTESVVRMMQAASATLTELQTSPLGIGGSAGK